MISFSYSSTQNSKGTPDLDFMIIMYLWVSLHLSTLIEMILVDRDPYGALLSAISMQI